MKHGGYSDSGADIAYELAKNGMEVITPVENPSIENDFDWVFPDTEEGIQNALVEGATVLWLNTVLYREHAIEHFFDRDIELVGQLPSKVDRYDDKLYTNRLLKEHQLPIPKTQLISREQPMNHEIEMDFPLVVKPLRGRGSQGVTLVRSKNELDAKLAQLFSDKIYGNAVYIEQYLSGREITVTVMPPGIYTINNRRKEFSKPWCLPAVKRFNHNNGIAPYSGVVAVMDNSVVLDDKELQSEAISKVYSYCERAAEIIQMNAPIRIDCRADDKGDYFLFDVNLKPNMTGPSRPQRKNQDSLTLLAARKLGWSYFDLLRNILDQRWKASTAR